MNNIKSAEENFSFLCPTAKSLDISSLEEVGGYFYLQPLMVRSPVKLDKLKSVNMSNGRGSRAIPIEDRSKGLFIGGCHMDLNLPELESVGGIFGIMNSTLINCPKLKLVSEKLFISTAPKCTQVSFPVLNSVPNIKIESMGQLSDFSTFATVIENGSVTDGNWEVTGCKYNPTWQDMKEGRYKPAE